MKKYINAELTIVSIKNDIVTASGEKTLGVSGEELGGGILLDAGRRMDDWDVGY